MKHIFGVFLLTVPFLGLFCLGWLLEGFKKTVQAALLIIGFGGMVASSVACIYWGMKLLGII